jgi:DNA invertase Pin-like site-specific DNA recombinase
MAGQQVGYIRISSIDQNIIRQLDGLNLDKIFTEKLSGKDTQRPLLQECLAYIRTGDTLHVHSIDRLARNAKDLLNLTEQVLGKGVNLKFHKNNLTFSPDIKDHMAKLQLTMLAAFAELKENSLKSVNEKELQSLRLQVNIVDDVKLQMKCLKRLGCEH